MERLEIRGKEVKQGCKDHERELYNSRAMSHRERVKFEMYDLFCSKIASKRLPPPHPPAGQARIDGVRVQTQ